MTRGRVWLLAAAGALGAGMSAAAAVPAVAGVLPPLIAYVKGNGSGKTGLWVVQPGHANTARPIFGPEASLGSPRWSPNGETLLVQTPSGAVLLNRAGHVIDKLGAANMVAQSWSPDGHEVAGPCTRGKILTVPQPSVIRGVPAEPATWPNLCVYNLVTRDVRVVAESSLADALSNSTGGRGVGGIVSWSQRGDVIAIDSQTNINTAGYCVNYRTSGTVNYDPNGEGCWEPHISLVNLKNGSITPIGEEFMSSPAFSPDGGELAINDQSDTVNGVGGYPQIGVISATGGGLKDLVRVGANGGSPMANGQPTWSPDGKDIAFASFSVTPNDGSEGLYAVNAKSGHVIKLTPFSIFATQYAGGPSWGPPLTVCTVPRLKGQTLAASKRLIALAGCTVGTVTGPKTNRIKRHVVGQNPVANGNVPVGTKVNLRLH